MSPEPGIYEFDVLAWSSPDGGSGLRPIETGTVRIVVDENVYFDIRTSDDGEVVVRCSEPFDIRPDANNSLRLHAPRDEQ